MKRHTTQEFINSAKNIYGDLYCYTNSIYKNERTKLKIVCNKHGIFYKRPYDHLIGQGCTKCSLENKKIDIKEFIKKSNIIHNSKYDYSKSVYIRSDQKIEIKCNSHGSFFVKPSFHLRGTGCPVCGGSQIKTLNFFIENANNVHKNIYDYSKSIYKNNNTKLVIICKKHGEFLQNPRNHLSGQGCPRCIHIISDIETDFLDYIKIPKSNRQIRIGKYKIDGINKSQKVIYEFLGDYWHGNPEKFNGENRNEHNKKTFKELYHQTFNKFEQLKSLGYNVKYIWESDWKKFNDGIDQIIKIYEYEKNSN